MRRFRCKSSNAEVSVSPSQIVHAIDWSLSGTLLTFTQVINHAQLRQRGDISKHKTSPHSFFWVLYPCCWSPLHKDYTKLLLLVLINFSHFNPHLPPVLASYYDAWRWHLLPLALCAPTSQWNVCMALAGFIGFSAEPLTAACVTICYNTQGSLTNSAAVLRGSAASEW